MEGWHHLHRKISFHVVTEEPKLEAFKTRLSRFTTTDPKTKTPRQDSIILHGVPKSFSPPKAKYKARALEYFRTHIKLTSRDWVLHLDEETFIDAYGINACLNVIERSDKIDYAQGYIMYNHHRYWRNWFMTLGDVVRVNDDMGRYRWQAQCVGRPVFGVHGSFFLINGEVENKVTWDTENLTEDYWFSQMVCVFPDQSSVYVLTISETVC